MSEFMWVAKYRDHSFKSSKDGLAFDRIPRRNLWYVELIAPTGKKIFTITYKQGYNVFYRRRAVMQPGSSSIEVVHLLGYQKQDLSVVAFLYESNWRIELSDFSQPTDRAAHMQEYKHQIEFLSGDLEPIVWD